MPAAGYSVSHQSVGYGKTRTWKMPQVHLNFLNKQLDHCSRAQAQAFRGVVRNPGQPSVVLMSGLLKA
ncbi:hypothetical protein ACWATR_38095 [Nostoc sp. UIC 10890]